MDFRTAEKDDFDGFAIVSPPKPPWFSGRTGHVASSQEWYAMPIVTSFGNPVGLPQIVSTPLMHRHQTRINHHLAHHYMAGPGKR
jgi:hypothetical protein